MTRRRADIHCPREPIGLSREEAARFIGIGSTLFDKLVDSGQMPGPRSVAGRMVWHAGELERAFLRLPVARGAVDEEHADAAWSEERLSA
jgi:predicted DNA-binding transcriptional regulator AlpA